MVYIYLIRRLGTDAFYAGSTNNYMRRWSEHRKKLRNNTHPTPPLQAAWNKYGEHNFEFFVVCICSNKNRILYEELFLPHAKYVCKTKVNEVCPAAKGRISDAKKGVPLSETHKQALSKAKLGKPASKLKKQQLVEHWSKYNTNKSWLEKRRKAIKLRYEDPQLREKMREIANLRWRKTCPIPKPQDL